MIILIHHVLLHLALGAGSEAEELKHEGYQSGFQSQRYSGPENGSGDFIFSSSREVLSTINKMIDSSQMFKFHKNREVRCFPSETNPFNL